MAPREGVESSEVGRQARLLQRIAGAISHNARSLGEQRAACNHPIDDRTPRVKDHSPCHASAPERARRSPHRGQPMVATMLRREFEARVRVALSGRMIEKADTVGELAVLARSYPLTLVITEPWDSNHVPAAATVRWLTAAYPSVAVIAYCEPTAAAHRETVPLTRAGIDGIIVRGVDDGISALRDAVHRACFARVQTLVMEVLRPMLSPDSAAFVAYCLGQGAGASVEQAAAALGVTRRTLVNRFAREGLIPPREILAWCRLLQAAYLLDDSGRSLEQVGLAIGCGSGSALRNLFLRHARVRPDAIRASGALAITLERFAASVRTGATSGRPTISAEFPVTTDLVLAATRRGEVDDRIVPTKEQ